MVDQSEFWTCLLLLGRKDIQMAVNMYSAVITTVFLFNLSIATVFGSSIKLEMLRLA